MNPGHVLVELAYAIRPSRLHRTLPAIARRQAPVWCKLDSRRFSSAPDEVIESVRQIART
jgi:hypothetical protein